MEDFNIRREPSPAKRTAYEAKLREYLGKGALFLKEHRSVFSNQRHTKGFEVPVQARAQANDLIRAINYQVKTLMDLGGNMPLALEQATKILEDLELVKGCGIFTYNQVLSSGVFEKPISQEDRIVLLRGFVAMRSTLVVREFGQWNGSDEELLRRLEEKAAVQILVDGNGRKIVTVADAIRPVFSLPRDDKFKLPENKDFGWLVPTFTSEQLMTETAGEVGGWDKQSDWIEGFTRRQFTLSERMSREARVRLDQGLRGVRDPLYGLTLTRESRTDTGLKRGRGKLPEFFDGAIKFGDVDITGGPEGGPVGALGVLEAKIKRKVEDAAPFLIGEILRERIRVLAQERSESDGLVRGQRKGLNPSQLYRNLRG